MDGSTQENQRMGGSLVGLRLRGLSVATSNYRSFSGRNFLGRIFKSSKGFHILSGENFFTKKSATNNALTNALTLLQSKKAVV